jgi:NAD(P)-dependent dehydrogenase (short-subunit alcohol dehydrogenase family)
MYVAVALESRTPLATYAVRSAPPRGSGPRMDRDESDRAYERYAAPGPGRVLWQGALANFNPHTAAIATGRFTTPQEVATLVTLLASDRTANVTGVNYVIDGGLIKTT